MAGTYNETLLRAVAFDRVRAWLAGDTGVLGLPAKPRIGELDRVTIDNDDVASGVPLQVTSVITTGGPVVDISAAALTTGKALDISNLAAITTGKAIHVDATGITQTTGVLVHVDSGSTALTGAGRLLLVDSTGDFNDAAGIVAEIKSVHTTGEALNVTVDAMTDGFGQRITADALTSGTALIVESTSTAQTTGKLGDFASTVSGDTIANRTGSLLSVSASRTDTRTSGTTADDFDLVSITRTNVMNGAGGTMTAAGAALRVENVATQTSGTLTDTAKVLEVVQDGDSTGQAILSTSGGTGNDLEVVNTNTGALGPKIELYHNPGNSQAADDDVVGRIRFQADDEEASSTKRQVASLDVQWTDATAASFASDLEIYLSTAAATNLAMTLSGGGQIGVDLDSDLSSSSAGGQIFDDYDDAKVLKQYAYLGVEKPEISIETVKMLESMGIVEANAQNQRGYLLKLQPFLRLVCGGIYQLRERFDSEIETLKAELATLQPV